MIRFLLAAGILLLPAAARAQMEQQTLVDRATLAVQDIMATSNAKSPQYALTSARAVMICPRVFGAAFIIGGSGGDCVLVARDGAGSWSYPAFYGIHSFGPGLQAGIQDSEVMILILTPKGLGAVMDNQFKFGIDAGLAVASVGAGIEGSTTTDLGADIVVVSRGRGLYLGVALQGSFMSTQTDANRLYYGRDLAARQIVIDMSASNPGADPLREMLTRYGSPPAPVSALPPPVAPAMAQASAAPFATGAPVSLAPVQQQALPPPHH